MQGLLEGVRVLDWTIWQQGPFASVLLADMGAEVIKLEAPDGDPGRWVLRVAGFEAQRGGVNFYFEANNRHKKSVVLDLKRPEARAVVHRLVARSDVFIQNFRTGVASRLELDYQTLRQHNPRLIYATASGYGPHGPDSAAPSFDYLAQARSGIMRVAGLETEEPVYLYGGLADQMGAIMLAYGVVCALLARERLGIGQEVNVSHLGSMTALQGLNVSCLGMMGSEMPRLARDSAYNPLWNHYRCADGKWLALGMLQADRYWKDFCRAVGLAHLAEAPRFAGTAERAQNRRELIAILDETFARRPRQQWLETFRREGDFIVGIVNQVADLAADPQVLANGYMVEYERPESGPTRLLGHPVAFSATPANPRGRAPELGEHTEAVLTELLGYSWEEIARLRAAGAILAPGG